MKAFSVNVEGIEYEVDDIPNMQPSPINEEVEEEVKTNLSKPEEILMACHLKLAHIPFTTLQNMAKKGHLPKNLAHCTPPKCQACILEKLLKYHGG